MAKIFVSRQIPGHALDTLTDSDHEVVISEYDRPLTPEEFLQGAKGADAVLSLLTDHLNGDVIDAIGPQLKLISNYAVGFDNINLQEATDRGVVVTNTPSDEVNQAVAEHTWALVLALARRIVEADESTRRGSYRGWEPSTFLGASLKGKTLGIIGLGRIGGMVAKMARGFDLQVLYQKRAPDLEIEKALGVKFASLDELLQSSDFISLHLPLTEETRHLINAETLTRVKKGALLVNTARGAIIHEQALVDALRQGLLGGVALDVYDNEPNINPELISMGNVILTPHIASATLEARNKMGEQAVSAVLDTLSGTKPANLVNPEVWDKHRT